MVKNYLSLVKFSHTIFALPFALVGFFLALRNDPGMPFPWVKLLLVLLCMVFARSAAMAFNRYLDRDIDALNERTAVREIPAGVISPGRALSFVVLNCVLFVLTTAFINPLCLFLAPVALAVVLGYSYTKRFTFLCHFVLGLGLALAPVGAYLAVAGSFSTISILYGLAVLLWVSGFDVIYSLQDEQFDRDNRLHSIPVRLGRLGALRLSKLLHGLCGVAMIGAAILVRGIYPSTGWLTVLATGTFLLLLIRQHLLVSPTDLSKVNLAFFTTNGIASVVFGSLLIVDLLT